NQLRMLNKSFISPGDYEIESNFKARSAKLRAFEKLKCK
ncbi:16S rRNA (cytosine(1402)-N(4))-methyltransferase, partial [Patescibacteria group bacterium]|nr:16S rRNA (cytosine(1402)-N(4))-methyltransferase [Patescibacteria group bacterium]